MSKTLLIVDDDLPFRERLSRSMEKKGFEVVSSPSFKDSIIKVNDNGSGITDAKKAMTPYFTTKKTGTGLGLPIVTKIINEHNGNFSIKNKKDNKGTIVTITLPKYA